MAAQAEVLLSSMAPAANRFWCGHSYAQQWATLGRSERPWLPFQRGEDRGGHQRPYLQRPSWDRRDAPSPEAEATPQQIRPITGHSLESIHRIIERYCARTDKLAGGAILKLEMSRG